MNPNFLFLNRGDGTFDDVSEISGAAFNINGMAQSGMGVDAEDVDGDGLPELFVTNFANEYSHPLPELRQRDLLRQHRLLRPGIRLDAVGQVGLRPGRLRQRRLARLSSSSTATSTTIAARSVSRSTTRRCPLLFRNQFGKGPSASAWRPATPGPISIPSTSAAARPLATSTTTATSTSWSTTRTPRRPCCATTPSRGNHWIRFVLQGTKSNRDAIGAKVVVTAEGRAIVSPAQGRLQHAERPTITGSWWAWALRRRRKGRDPLALRSSITLENLKVDQEYKVVEPKSDSTITPGGIGRKRKAARADKERRARGRAGKKRNNRARIANS